MGSAMGQMNAFQRAWIDFRLALAAYHAAQECEAQVAHWVMEGTASRADLLEAQQRTAAARTQRTRARKRYICQSWVVGAAAGAKAGALARTDDRTQAGAQAAQMALARRAG